MGKEQPEFVPAVMPADAGFTVWISHVGPNASVCSGRRVFLRQGLHNLIYVVHETESCFPRLFAPSRIIAFMASGQGFQPVDF